MDDDFHKKMDKIERRILEKVVDDNFNKEALDIAYQINDALVQPYASMAQRTSRIQIIVRKALQAAFAVGQNGRIKHSRRSRDKPDQDQDQA